MLDKINLTAKLAQFDDLWAPRVVGKFEGFDLKVAKVNGEFVKHTHDETDEFFLVLSGRLTLRMQEGEIVLDPGELYVVPRGVEHEPYAQEETHILLIEPPGTLNTGDASTAAPRREI